MKLIKTEQFPSILNVKLNKSCEYWDLGKEYIADICSYDQNNEKMYICLHNKKDIYTLSPAERCIKDEIFARKIQKNIDNIKIDYGIDAVYIVCSKDQLMDVLNEIERHITDEQF